MIGVVDAGYGNVGSILGALVRIGLPARTVSRAGELATVDRIILPGVGAFDPGMTRLHDSGLADGLRRRVAEGMPLLGVCLGLQMLGRASDEGTLPGLALIPATTRRLDVGGKAERPRLPHMGWNLCHPSPSARLLEASQGPARGYFAHSYHVVCDEPGMVVGWSRYGVDFASMIQHGRVYGVQFHPEKSHRWGLVLLRRFAEIG